MTEGDIVEGIRACIYELGISTKMSVALHKYDDATIFLQDGFLYINGICMNIKSENITAIKCHKNYDHPYGYIVMYLIVNQQYQWIKIFVNSSSEIEKIKIEKNSG